MKDRARATTNYEGYLRFTKNHKLAKDITTEWHGSKAKRKLKQDVANGRHKRHKPKDLYLKRKSYQKFPYEVFRGHIYQESRHLVESGYWLVKKEKIRKKKEAKKLGKKYKDDDNDFFDPVLQFDKLENYTYNK